MKRQLTSIVCGLASFLIVTEAHATSSINSPYMQDGVASAIQLDGTYQLGSLVSLTNTYNIAGGDVLFWSHNGVSFIGAGMNGVHYVKGLGTLPNGQKATILNFALENRTHDNGYLLVPEQDVSDWQQALDGNSKYVSIYAPQSRTTLSMSPTLTNSWSMDWLPDVAALCGAKIVYKGGASSEVLQVDPSGTTATPIFDVITTPAPQSAISMPKSSFTVGDSVPISLTAKLYAAATNWHMEAVHVVGPNGYSKFLKVDTGANGTAAAADGTAFPYYGEAGPGTGALATVYGGGSGDPISPAVVNETATLDSSGMQPGTYTVSYTLYDAVGRAASNSTDQIVPGTVSTSFTLTPGTKTPQPPTQPTSPPLPPPPPQQPPLSQPPGGASVPPGTSYPPVPTPPPAKHGDLDMEFPQNNPIGINHYGTEPVRITNNSGRDITTTLTATIHTFIDVPYQFNYQSGTTQVQTGTDASGNPTYQSEPVYTTTTRYAMRAVTGTETKTLTVPAKKSVTWTIGTSMIDTLDGTSISFQGLTPGGPWIPHGAMIPGSGAPDTPDNNDGYCGDTDHMSSQIGKENGNPWVPNLLVNAQDPQDYLQPQDDEPILTFGLKPTYPVIPVISQ